MSKTSYFLAAFLFGMLGAIVVNILYKETLKQEIINKIVVEYDYQIWDENDDTAIEKPFMFKKHAKK